MTRRSDVDLTQRPRVLREGDNNRAAEVLARMGILTEALGYIRPLHSTLYAPDVVSVAPVPPSAEVVSYAAALQQTQQGSEAAPAQVQFDPNTDQLKLNADSVRRLVDAAYMGGRPSEN